MTETISFYARATGADLRLRIKFDGEEIFCQEIPGESVKINHQFNDAVETKHVLEVEMQGKISEHTRLDADGTILEDRWIEISDVEIGGIVLGHMLTETAVYEHDTNGTAERQQHKFFNIMGCNGVLRLEFTSPVYLWLLEHM